MSAVASQEISSSIINQIQNFVLKNKWEYERLNDSEITFVVENGENEYHFLFFHSETTNSIHVASGFDVAVSEKDHDKLCQLITYANQKMWLGHFGVCPDTSAPNFCYTMLAGKGQIVDEKQFNEIIDTGVTESQKLIYALQLMLKEKKSPRAAIEKVSNFDIFGEA